MLCHLKVSLGKISKTGNYQSSSLIKMVIKSNRSVKSLLCFINSINSGYFKPVEHENISHVCSSIIIACESERKVKAGIRKFQLLQSMRLHF